MATLVSSSPQIGCPFIHAFSDPKDFKVTEFAVRGSPPPGNDHSVGSVKSVFIPTKMQLDTKFMPRWSIKNEDSIAFIASSLAERKVMNESP